jgi:hypothetical protein
MTKLNRALFSSKSPHYQTPKDLYEELDKEFHFNDDPCPLGNGIDGLLREWGGRLIATHRMDVLSIGG